ncbi:MAG TPA: hypothetical protein PLF81_20040 [Candidatus Anammoximicrobium sp.]|nr:hypothetical protein [Candidatus Anammoximicrobium sp.]
MSCSERRRELRRRRKRAKKITHLKRRVPQASVSEKAAMAGKIRRMTPGGETIVAKLGLEER